MAQGSSNSAKISRLLRKVRRNVFEVGPLPAEWDVLERLMSLVIQGDGKMAQAERVVQALRGAFQNWNEVRVARAFEIQELLAARRCGRPAERTEIIHNYLRRIFGMQNHLELDWMMDATSERRQKLLEVLPMVPAHASAVLDLDAQEVDEAPMHPSLKRLAARLGLTSSHPKESAVREIFDPHTMGNQRFPHYLILRVLAEVGCDPKNSRSHASKILLQMWEDSSARSTKLFEGLVEEFGLAVAAKSPRKTASTE